MTTRTQPNGSSSSIFPTCIKASVDPSLMCQQGPPFTFTTALSQKGNVPRRLTSEVHSSTVLVSTPALIYSYRNRTSAQDAHMGRGDLWPSRRVSANLTVVRTLLGSPSA